MIKTLYIRVIITFLIIMICSLTFSFIIGLNVFQKSINLEGQKALSEVGKQIIGQYNEVRPKDKDHFFQSMVNISSHPIHLYNSSGDHTYYNLDNSPPVIITTKAVQSVIKGQIYRSTSEEKATFVGIPVLLEGEWHAMFLQYSSESENIFNKMMLFVLLLVLFTGCLGIFIAARYLVEPIKALTRATKKLAKGNFDVQLKVNRVDEIGELTESYIEMASELKQLEQMRQDFVSNVSHEIQTPLTSISGFAKALHNEDLIASEDRKEYLDIIITESARLSRLSENLLKLASLDSDQHPFEATVFHLDEQIRRIVVTCEPQWSAKNIDIELDMPVSLNIEGDEDQLKQVWMNLLSNSIKFTPQDGHISIVITTTGTEVTVMISDTGIGISPNELSIVFQRFYKADKARGDTNGGSGLGLAIVKKIVAVHHGNIDIESTINQGTSISITLPLISSSH